MTTLPTHTQDDLLAAAREVCQKAYAPYSRYYVGAAVLTEAGHIYQGCNVENVSYGLCVCAERNAIAQAIVEEGSSMKLKAIAVVNGDETTCTPCGACRQVIAEFGSHAMVIYRSDNGWSQTPAYTFLPGAFEFAKEKA